MTASGTEEGAGAPVQGVDVDAQGRCAHWGSPVDIVSFRFPCCEGWWACHACHEAVADHPAEPWPPEEFGTVAVLCGACGGEMPIVEYLASGDACPRCHAAFNPRCSLHRPRYFRVEGQDAS